MWIKTSQTGTCGPDSSSKNSKILSNFYTVSASSQKGNLPWRRLIDTGLMKGKRVFMYVYLALQKLSYVFFQGHRLNWTIVLLNAMKYHGPIVDSSGTCVNPQPKVLLECFADSANYLLFPRPYHPSLIHTGLYWVESCLSEAHVPLEPQKVTLFENSIFADVIS